tara:strand:+ start:173 stop:1165 length:993 start_codon:yes stop_codon:yes gene_type:complete
MRKVFLIFLFFQVIVLASQSDLPEVYTVKIEDKGNDVSFYLDQAVLEAIVRATGSFKEIRESKKIIDLDLNSFVREYKFLQEQKRNFIEIKIDAVELRSKLFKLNFPLFTEKKLKAVVWINCNLSKELKSKTYQIAQDECNNLKKNISFEAKKRGGRVIYPILDSTEMTFYEDRNIEGLENIYFNNEKYSPDGWMYCNRGEEFLCYLPQEPKNIFSNLNPYNSFLPYDAIQGLLDKISEPFRVRSGSKNKKVLITVEGNTSFETLQMFKGVLGQNFLIKNSFLHRLEDKMFSFMVTTESNIDDLVEVMLTDNLLTLRSKSLDELIFQSTN